MKSLEQIYEEALRSILELRTALTCFREDARTMGIGDLLPEAAKICKILKSNKEFEDAVRKTQNQDAE